jgi:hypothetical protein
MMKRQIRRTTAGLSFAEVMVAVLILGVGLLPALWVFSRSNAGTMMTRDEIIAHSYASSLIDYSHAVGFADLPATPPEGSLLTAISLGSRELAVDTRFECRLTVTPVVPEEPDAVWPLAYKTVTADIRWKTGEVAQSHVLTTQVFQGLVATP